ncbi:uncharacterized protein LOC113213713 isoform X3 [Frankliniella occidentalis]|uniref:Uncharacterized protein LOC113213713 isoform X3 n=1 Tax=Frankliniella occidentalis TaxID=133901 RepID=A0A6J1TCS5_FRAOC|nr:uncharacterized protein LOC113213713 isoform X3 [Frankliniella occidentalis]
MMDTSHTPHKSCKMSLPLRLLLLLSLLAGPALAQSNYAQQGNSVEYDGNSGLPDQATLNGRVTKLDDLSPVIFLNRTKAVLNCEAGSMKAELKFNEPFFGIVYADFDRNSACQVAGKGALSYRIELPLKGCGTRQDPQRVFTNNIVVRFHPGLEMDGDEVITIVCRYPPPIAQPPAAFPAKIRVDAPVIPLEPPLQGFQILLIICAILFLSLLLLGLGCSYYCLRTRNIQVVRRAPFLADTESESSKLSNPSLGPVSLFEGLKIPRAHTAVSLSSSEQHLVSEPSDTLPSDYPSESPSSAHSEVEEVVRAAPPPPRPSLSTLTTETADFRTIVDTEELTSTQRVAARPPPPPIVEEVIEQLEAPVVAERRPEITSHVVDDVFLRTITEKKTIEDIERHRRQVKEFHAKPPPPNPKWDVVIRNYPAPGQEALAEPATDWESYSETSSASGYPTTPVLERPLEKHITDRRVNVSEQLQQRSEMHRSSVDVERTYRSSMTIPPPEPPPPNWDVLIRVLDQPEMPEPRDHDDLSVSEVGEEPMTITTTATTTALTQEDREKWRQILTTESSLRTLLTEATVKEDYERIRSDERYERLFEPAKWDVIIRVLAPPERLYDPKGGPANGQRYRRKTDWDTRSRRSSLPTLYEYDSDGTSSLTMTTEGHEAIRDLARSRRTSRSSMPSMSDMDVRSMTEVMVDYTRPERADTLSDASGPSSLYYRGGAPRRYSDDEDAIEDDYGTLGLARSLSQPSLARSASEFTEHWAVVRGPPSPTSPRSSARSTRSSRGRGPAPLPPGHQAAGTTTTTTALVHPPQGHHNVQSYSVQSESQQGATRTQTRSSGYVAQRGWFSEQ